VARANGETESIPSSAPPLGLMERLEFAETEVDLAPGDAFFLYTDGLYGTAENAEAQRLTPAGLAKMLQPLDTDAQSLLARVVQRATIGHGDKPLADDVAAIAAKRLG
jgi:serine phosphatase RsbU (regulator of sigma subunit)